MFFKKRGHVIRNKKQLDDDYKSSDKNRDAFAVGSTIAKLITSSWNSQEKPVKVYIFKRRIHHGGIGSLLGLSDLFRKTQPIPSGILSGLGEGLAKDDYADRDEWFKFERKQEDNKLVRETKIDSSDTDYDNNNNTKRQQKDVSTMPIKETKNSSSTKLDEENGFG
jgi:hypothetical protein